jgi:hypothetical protein
MAVSITTDQVWAEVEAQRFAVLSYVTPKAEARSAGVVYIVRDRKLYVRAATDSWKARHIDQNPQVALNVTIPKRIPFLPWIRIPAATIAFHGTARVVAAQDAEPGVLQAISRAIPDHEGLKNEMSIIEIVPAGHFLTYGIGTSLLAMRDPETARARVPVARVAAR